jgi:hypothetical protein
MHGPPPTGAIIIHKISEDEHPDFSGPGFLAAKKAMLMSTGEPDMEPAKAGEPMPVSEDTHAELMEIAGQLREASKKHLGQAERIEELCARMMGEEPKAKEKEDKAYSEAKELE